MNDNIKISLFCHNKYEIFCAVVRKSKFVLNVVVFP